MARETGDSAGASRRLRCLPSRVPHAACNEFEAIAEEVNDNSDAGRTRDL